MKHVLCSLLFLSLASGCASDVPLVIREPLPDNPSLADVQRDPNAFVNRRVRWGGRIVSTKNAANKTEVEILAKAVGSDGRPEAGDASLGRFIAKSGEYLDRDIYSADREVTVYGVLENVLMRKIGEHAYTYPLVQAVQIYLWPERSDSGDSPWYPQIHFGLGVGVGL